MINIHVFGGMKVNNYHVLVGERRGAAEHSLAGRVFKVFVRKQGNRVDIHIDNNRVHTEQLDPVALSKLSQKLVSVLKGRYINKGMHVLVTDIVVSQE